MPGRTQAMWTNQAYGRHCELIAGLHEGRRKPLRALAVAEDAPAGAMTGRVGAGPNGAGPPPR